MMTTQPQQKQPEAPRPGETHAEMVRRLELQTHNANAAGGMNK